MPQSSTATLSEERSQLAPVFAYVDQHAEEFVERLRSLCRQPSVSAQNLGLNETFAVVDDIAIRFSRRCERA